MRCNYFCLQLCDQMLPWVHKTTLICLSMCFYFDTQSFSTECGILIKVLCFDVSIIFSQLKIKTSYCVLEKQNTVLKFSHILFLRQKHNSTCSSFTSFDL